MRKKEPHAQEASKEGKETRAGRILNMYSRMQMHDRKGRGSGGNLQRTEVVSIRLDPKLRYLTELGARKERSTISNFIESAIEDKLRHVILRESTESGRTVEVSIQDEAETLWDIDDPDRLAKLGLHYPALLTIDEQIVWKLIRETGYLWRGKYDSQGYWTWKVEQDSLLYDRLRENWHILIDVAAGEVDRSALPQTPRKTSADSKDADRSSDDALRF